MRCQQRLLVAIFKCCKEAIFANNQSSISCLSASLSLSLSLSLSHTHTHTQELKISTSFFVCASHWLLAIRLLEISFHILIFRDFHCCGHVSRNWFCVTSARWRFCGETWFFLPCKPRQSELTFYLNYGQKASNYVQKSFAEGSLFAKIAQDFEW